MKMFEDDKEFINENPAKSEGLGEIDVKMLVEDDDQEFVGILMEDMLLMSDVFRG